MWGQLPAGWSQCEVALLQAARGSRSLLPCSHSREALPGHRRGHLLARQRVPPQAHSPEELSPSASCQDLATGLPGLPYSPPRPWPLRVRSNSPGCGMAAGGARAQRGTGVPGDRAGPSLPQAAASPRCPPPRHALHQLDRSSRAGWGAVSPGPLGRCGWASLPCLCRLLLWLPPGPPLLLGVLACLDRVGTDM